MSRYNTNNPVPSNEVKDFSDNAQIVDEIVHSQQSTTKDRFGNDLKTWRGIQQDANEAISQFGYITMDSFQDGATLTLPNQALRWKLPDGDGEYYRWDGEFPVGGKVVPPGSTPETTGGVGLGAWLSVGDATLRGQISDPDGATLYPDLQIARWRDDGDARGWGVFPDGTDVTEKMCAWLDAVNGDYSKLPQYGQYRYRGFLPAGDYVVTTANLTGNHAILGRLIIRSDIRFEGRVPNGDFTILHVKSINIEGLSCKSVIAQGLQLCHLENIDTSGDFVLKGSTSALPAPGIAAWGGGSYWNNITRLKTGTTSGGGKLYLNIYEGSVNQNIFTQVSGGGLVLIGSGAGLECNANTFVGLDTSGSADYLLDNQCVPAQHNTVIGLYGETLGTGRVRGPWTILGARANFNGWGSTVSHMCTFLGTDPTAAQSGGESFSVSARNLCPSGDWSILGPKGTPVGYSTNLSAEDLSFEDLLEPGGAMRYYGLVNPSVRSRISIALSKTQTGYIRGAFFFRGDNPVEIAIEDIANPDAPSTTIYFPVDKYFNMGTSNNWKLYRISAPTLDKSKTYRLRITVDVGKTALLGCSFFSAYNGTMMPTFAGWDQTKFRSSAAPVVVNTVSAGNTIPLGTRCERNFSASVPSDPVIGWSWNGNTWLKISASA